MKPNKWTKEELEALKVCYSTLPVKGLVELPELANRSENAIRNKASALGLRKYKKRGEKTDKEGYNLLYFPLCPYAWSDGRVYEHHLVWWLNYPLDTILKNEVIHHKNGNRKDNRIENLQKLGKDAHLQLHRENGDLNW